MSNPKINHNIEEIPKKPSIFSLLSPYKVMLFFLVILAFVSNGLSLFIPKIIASSIDAYTAGNFIIDKMVIEFSLVSILIFIFTYLQSVVQTYASEKVARDMRAKLSAKISRQSYEFVQTAEPSKLLTNLTSDIDSIKLFVSQAIVSIISSLIIIIGASVLLIMIDLKLALVVLTIIPIIGGSFFLIFSKVKTLFLKTREVIDALNKTINESILGAGLIRLINSQQSEYKKFLEVNTNAKSLGLQILALFASLIPIITFVAGMATLAILYLGGHFVISGAMSLGNFTAFYSYLALLIFPIIIIGFMSNVIAQASASYERILKILESEELSPSGTLKEKLHGDITFENVSVLYGEKYALKNVSFSLKAKTKTAIIGPTAAGKTQLLYLLTALIKPDSGAIKYDGRDIDVYDPESLHNQVGFVFQDSIIFNLSLKNNIAFSKTVTDESLKKAIEAAEISDFINSLPDKLETIISERGTSLSGGQKQRLMLARALALNPQILLLDDFTARVDILTEQSILENISKNYPDLTLVSVTQKISSIKNYDHIILIMEGEVLGQGTHEELLATCPEYVQIYDSQQSTNTYE